MYYLPLITSYSSWFSFPYSLGTTVVETTRIYNFRSFLFLSLTLAAYIACECSYKTNTQYVFPYALCTNFKNTNLSSFENSPDWKILFVLYSESSSRPYAINFIISKVNIADGKLLYKCSAYNTSTSSVPPA